ncbi:hypothetical protein GALL_387840 [mine drainage metagenome]|uniref:YbjN domain-containing protein n=1 Tax=mine drainage metagenome TaxID=410659 RepID=A0A1J5Q8F9_9ZZZZ
MSNKAEVVEIVRATLEEEDLPFEVVGNETFVVTLPGAKKRTIACSLSLGDYSLVVNAFVMRAPDENQVAVYKYLLEQNSRTYGVHFSLNSLGDIFLVGRLPLGAVNSVEIDRILGAVLEYSESHFDQLLELGFASAIRREWAWRIERGESLENLAAFKHLIAGANE